MNHHAQGGPGSAGDLPDVRPGTDDAREALRRRRDEAVAAGPSEATVPVTIAGVVRWLDLEGGVWVLDPRDEAHSGGRLQLLGVVEPSWAEREVVVTGVLRPDLRTAAQVGPVLEVSAGEVAGG